MNLEKYKGQLGPLGTLVAVGDNILDRLDVFGNYRQRQLTERGQDLQQMQHEERLFVQLYEGRENRQAQAWQHKERQLAQLLEGERNRDLQDRQHKERLLAQLKEGETNRDFQLKMFDLQRKYQLEIKQLEMTFAREMRQKDRLLQLELIKAMRQSSHNPLYPGVDAVLSNPVAEGLQKVHLIFSPPVIKSDRVIGEKELRETELKLTTALGIFADMYQEAARPVRFQGGAWVSKTYHGQAAAGTIFAEMRTEPVILLEASAEGNDYFIKLGSWWENALEFEFKHVLSFSWVNLLNDIIKKRVLSWQASQQKHQLSDMYLKDNWGTEAFLAYKESLLLMEYEQNNADFGFVGVQQRHRPLPTDLDELTQLLSLYHKIFVGIALDDYFLLNPVPKFRQKPLLPTLLPDLLKKFPDGQAFLAQTLMPHYEKLYGHLIETESAWAADLYIDLANVLLSLNQAEQADKALEKAFQALWGLGEKVNTTIVAPEQVIEDYKHKVTKDDYAWLSMIYEKVELMPMARFKNLAPAVRSLLIESSNLNVLHQASVLHREAEAKAAKEAEERAIAEKERQKAEELRKAYEPEMIVVEGGTFRMGSNEYSDEQPIHNVTLTTFLIGKYPITQAQWQKVMGSNPSDFKGDNLPVESVSWEDAQVFINKLNLLVGKTYRLPTEAEWEFAARGGHKSVGYKYSGSNNIDEVAWYDGNSDEKTHPVGCKKGNELEIHDMSGNVWEWCSDWYSGYSSGSQSNPTGVTSGSYRVFRGGSWFSNAVFCRPTYRNDSTPTDRNDYIGFRVCLTLQ
jgi:formylglycine-generating enzyme required for sulfatase activity